MPGDVVVRKVNGREKMCGYCRAVKSVASVRILGSKQILYNIRSEDLQPIEVIFGRVYSAVQRKWLTVF